jgi:nitric oxide reductase NorE protein
MTAIQDVADDAIGGGPVGEDGAPRRFPGDPDMWVFVIVESLVFTSYFCVYLYARTQHERAFLDAQSALTMWLGILDTIVLLTSSWAIARCVQHTRAADDAAARRLAFVTAGLGVTFFALKIAEWVHLIGDGHTFTSSEFMQHFFFLTSIHAVHLVIGFVALGVLVYQLSDARRRSHQTIETCATYWHTVDLFWVVIFALLYVVR